ncbi:MAG: DUF4388 domain-containing protein [Actinomycetota bacterium]
MLQGSLDDFALDEMLGLLASTSKTGKLEVKGDRGHGSLRLHHGRLVDAGASNTANGVEPEDVLFELLRFNEGNFHFNASEVEEGAFASDVTEVLGSAERRLADWRTIEVVVPSLRHMVTPVTELPADEITIDRSDWKALIVVGAGCTVAAVCDELDLGEVEGSRKIKMLTERGMVAVGPPKASGLRRSGIDAVRAGAVTSSANGTDPAANGATTGPSTDSVAPSIPAPANGDQPPPPEGAAAKAPVVAEATVDGEAESRPPHPDAGQAPPAGLSTLAPAVRQPIDAGSSERSGGLLMRYLKNDD